MSNERSTPRFRSRTAAAVALAILVMDLFVVAGAWRTMRVERGERYAEAERTAQNLARVLAENLEGTIRLVDLALREARAELVRRNDVHAPSDATLDWSLARLLANIPALDGLRIAGPDGLVEHGMGPRTAPPISIANRDYFIAAKAGPSAELIVSEPVVSRISGKRSIAMARRIDLAGGVFGGIVYAVLPLDRFTATLASVDAGPGGAVVLRGGDNAILARFPEGADLAKVLGHKSVTPALAATLASGRTESTFVAVSPIDRREKVNAFRRIQGGSFYLMVAASSDTFLASWRGEVVRVAVALGLFVLVSAAAAAWLLRAWRKESETRFRDLVEGAPIAVALTRGGRVLYVNREFVRVVGLRDASQAVGRSIVDSMGPRTRRGPRSGLRGGCAASRSSRPSR